VIGLAFANPLGVTVTANAANEPVNGGVITYTVPGSGASASLSSPTATIDSSGQASVTATANGTGGSYAVTAAFSGSAAAGIFNLTNVRPTLGTLSPPEITVGQGYSGAIPISNDTGQYSIQSTSGLGSLSAAINGSAVTISGTAPSTAQTINFTITVEDSTGATGSGSYSLIVAPVGTYTVTNTSSSSSVVGSLPWAVTQADSDTSGTAIVNFAAGTGQTFATAQTIPLAATLNVSNITSGESILVEGPTAALTIQGGGSGSGFSVFTVAANTTATIEDLTISHGNASSGGGIANSGTLTVSNTTLTGNSASDGGGIASSGILTVSNTTLTGNSASDGGGIANSGTLTATDATLAGNSASDAGGGILNSASLTALDTIVAGNTATNANPDIAGSITTDTGYNVLGTAVNNSTNDPTPGAHDVFSDTPLLAALGSYGGPTQTLALLPGSPAIGAGSASGAPSTDQRGISRPSSGAPDIGAFQSQGFTLSVNAGASPQTTVIGLAFANPLGVTVTANAANEPVTGGAIAYTVPGSGASASLSSRTATLDSSGHASVTATANGTTGSYSVTASASGVATSATFNLTNYAAASQITQSPTSVVYKTGAVVTFIAAASGEPAPTVQWLFRAKGQPFTPFITGGTSPTLTFTATKTFQNALFEAVFTNSQGNATTSVAFLGKAPSSLPHFVSPASKTVQVGHTATFKTGSSVAGVTVQWQVSTDGGQTWSKDTADQGATSTTLSVVSTASDNGNQYRALLTSVADTVSTTAARLTVTGIPLAITVRPPTFVTGIPGYPVTITAAATGCSPTSPAVWEVSSNGGVFKKVTSNDFPRAVQTTTLSDGVFSTTLTFTYASFDYHFHFVFEAVFSSPAGKKLATSRVTLTD